ncbi:hypothetical protein [Aphanothece hegewaldii]|uniref:hypothetical protein n=1 Tax=Aphanothece hegewaldii TaxID=1521625 RepID=UPI001C627743|nr:hypothetical protein [Aphanothece hegewaldii]
MSPTPNHRRFSSGGCRHIAVTKSLLSTKVLVKSSKMKVILPINAPLQLSIARTNEKSRLFRSSFNLTKVPKTLEVVV